ncbi:MAG TPA: flagellar export protein FliJ [Solirubrobacteraceae bacterium]|jgi:flagellar FliJ protein|nr:flagellar export protein FliJ [Solirubrobacteraceae bacterium]
MADRDQLGRTAKEAAGRVDKQAVSGPSFRFRLERVRAVRERKEKLAQQELARSISRLSSTREELRSAEEVLERAQDEQRSAAGPVGAAELQSRQAFLERIEARRTVSELDVTRGEAEVADRNADLVVAAGEHEMLNRLRDRRRGEHERESMRRENKVLDEMAARARGSAA